MREQGHVTARAGLWQARAGCIGCAIRRGQGWASRVGPAVFRQQARREPLEARGGVMNFLRGERIPEGAVAGLRRSASSPETH
jgi:hypothetical protein